MLDLTNANYCEQVLAYLSCSYVGSAASTLVAFVLYDFVSKDDAEDDKKGKGESNEGQQSGTGLGDGEGEKATTEDLESEDIFDTAEKPGQEKQDENEAEKPETKEEQVMTISLEGQRRCV